MRKKAKKELVSSLGLFLKRLQSADACIQHRAEEEARCGTERNAKEKEAFVREIAREIDCIGRRKKKKTSDERRKKKKKNAPLSGGVSVGARHGLDDDGCFCFCFRVLEKRR